ncbi:MAG TPA: GspE/PulE family protein [Candidatus Paceibacterota bacterium]|jgi:type IV pilus assembly protein PilB|nr:GspE/PulE family protein [Candidatus Paceibacterota bacterium]
MHIEETQLKDFILDSGLVSRADIAKAEEESAKSGVGLAKTLVGEGKLTDDDVRRMQAYILGIPFVNLTNEHLDFSILSLIPEPIARKHNIVAFKKSDTTLEVAMLDTEDLAAIDFMRKKVGLKILPRLTDSASMKHALLQYQKSLKAEFGDIIQKEAAHFKNTEVPPASADGTALSEKEDGALSAATEGDLKKMAEDLPVVKIVETLLKHAILQNASDIHIEPQENQMLVRYRIDGLLHDAMVLPLNIAESITARIKVLASLKLDEKRLPQDGRFKIDMNGEKVSFRVSTLPTYYGEKTVMRVLRESVAGFTLEVLGFHGQGLEWIHKASKQTTGMILTTGPTGSGKSTTLYTLLDILNEPTVNISTIEDPIEYQMKRVNQTQVKPEIGFSFSAGLRTLVRQDPDIIMVGEIRDGETASLAVNASLTGHLVLSTLHTNSAAGAVPRLIDMKIEPFLIVSTLDVVIGQRLVRKLEGEKEKYFLSKDEIKVLSDSVDLDRVLSFLVAENIVEKDATWDKIPFYKPKAQGEGDDGYKGRMGIYEVLKMSSAIKELVMKGGTTQEIEDQAKKEGMMTMIEDGIFKAVSGLTTIEEVLRVITE